MSKTFRSLGSVQRDHVVNVLDYVKFIGGGVDQSTELQAALDAVEDYGGVVYIPSGVEILCTSNVTIPTQCDLIGDTFATIDAFSTNKKFSSVVVGSSASIIMESSSGLFNLRVLSESLYTAAPAADPEPNFSGTGIEVNSTDITIDGCSIFGFTTGITSTGPTGRTYINNLKMDNTACIVLDNSQDTSRLENVQCWPFAGGFSDTDKTRSGTAIKLQNNADWTRVTNCFTWGYTRGFWLNASRSNVELIGCGSDYPYLNVFSEGVLIDGDSGSTTIVGFQSELTQNGITVNITPSADNLGHVMVNSSYFGRNARAINLTAGDATIMSSHINGQTDGVEHLTGLTDGIYVNGAASNVIASNNFYQNLTAVGSVALRENVAATGARVLNNNMFLNVTTQGSAT